MGIFCLENKSKKKEYYELMGKHLKQNFDLNFEVNIETALFRKYFTQLKGDYECMENTNYSWISYLLEKLNDDRGIIIIDKSNWKQLLYDYIEGNNFFTQYLFQNEIFYTELILNHPFIKGNKEHGKHFLESEPLIFSLGMNELKTYASDNDSSQAFKTYGEGSMRFSFNSCSSSDDGKDNSLNYNLTMNMSETESIINNSEYVSKYNSYIFKKYMKIIREQLQKKEHPINVIINRFIECFKSHLMLNIDSIKNEQLNSKKRYDKGLVIVKEIQDFIETMQVALKLFYAKSIKFKYFADEKDEIINLISYLLFNNKSFYDLIYDLFKYMNNEKISELESKLVQSKNINPKDCGVHPKFCLNEDSEKFWKEYKNKPSRKTENSDKNSTEEDTSIKQKKSLKNCVTKVSKEILSEAGDDKTSYTRTPSIKNMISTSKNSIINDENFINFETQDLDRTYEGKQNIKEKLLEDLENSILPILPKIPKDNEIVLPNEPYSLAITYLKRINSYKTPLEKLTMISYISVIIMDSVDKYWENRNEEMPPNFLNLDADEIMSIYLYILYKIDFPEIVIHLEFIKHFTTSVTKQSIYGYYYSTIEGCLRYLQQTEIKK